MAQGVRELAELQAKEQKRFLALLRGVSKTPWWKEYIRLITERRAQFYEDLASGMWEQRAEDRIRGMIAEDTWTILLAQQAENIILEGDGNGNAS